MVRRVIFALIWGIAAMLPAVRPVDAEVDVHIGIGIPPPPSIVFQAEPPVIVVPQTDVYYVPEASGYDMYRYGSWWYVNRDGYWYRARSYRGPFGHVEYSRVPRRIIGIPGTYRHFPVRPDGHHPPHRRSGDAPGHRGHHRKDQRHERHDHDHHDSHDRDGRH